MSCAYGHCQPQPIPKAVNLFVKVTDCCNARCKFCSNGQSHSAISKFNHVKLWEVVDELRNKGIIINRINITGGEPSVASDTVNQILEKAASEPYHNIHLHLNTNGLLPASQEMMRLARWNSISMSLHHYDRSKLSEIYGVSLSDKALEFDNIDLQKVNASCNLVRGYIDNPAEVENMMKFAISLKLLRLGFVALMKVNDYCRERYVDFDEINFTYIPHLYFTESRNRGTDCKCSNYLYNHNGKILEVYMRNYANPNYCESSLLYDGQYLRQGFHDDNIIY
ncbi:MAG: radical SAM protein [Muribaculaceae bacterium]|nr:radical SAM protein [Muribaculaceae bacterium]